jgi:hypothetical protein
METIFIPIVHIPLFLILILAVGGYFYSRKRSSIPLPLGTHNKQYNLLISFFLFILSFVLISINYFLWMNILSIIFSVRSIKNGENLIATCFLVLLNMVTILGALMF